jgi:hypothetical protein
MANDSVIFDVTAAGAKQITQVQSYLKAARAVLEDIKSNSGFQNDGAGDWALLEAYLGLPAGTGEAFYNRIAGSTVIFDSGAVHEVAYVYVPSG